MVGNNPVLLVDFEGLAPSIFDDIRSMFGEGNKEARAASEVHFSEYLQPQIVARKDLDKGKALSSVMQRLPKLDVKAADEFLKGVEDVLTNGIPTVNVSPDAMGEFSGSGMVNYWRGDKKDRVYGERRARVEENMFQYGSSNNSIVKNHHSPSSRGFNPNLRPVYGALQVLDDRVTVGGAPNYGAAAFHFSDASKKYMTMSGSDSLNMDASIDDLAVFENVYPLISSMSRDTFEVVRAVVEGRVDDVSVPSYANYIEVQAHSKSRWSDFREVVFESEGAISTHPKNKKIFSFLNKNSLAIRYKG
jgi:insecticidal toxin complex protein TccC